MCGIQIYIVAKSDIYVRDVRDVTIYHILQAREYLCR